MIKAIAEKSLISDWQMIFIPPLFFFFQFTSEDSTLQSGDKKGTVVIWPWGALGCSPASRARTQPTPREPQGSCAKAGLSGAPPFADLCALPCLVPAPRPPYGEWDLKRLCSKRGSGWNVALRCDPEGGSF